MPLSAVKRDDRLLGNALFHDLRAHPADELVHVRDHGGKPLLGGRCLGRIRCRHEWHVGQQHRVIDEERTGPMRFNEFQYAAVVQVGAEHAFAEIHELGIVADRGPPVGGVEGVGAFGIGPADEVFVETRIFRVESAVDTLFVAGGSQLPLAGDQCAVSRCLQRVRERGDFGAQVGEFLVVPVIVLPRHDLDPGRGADRLRVRVVEPHALGREAVDFRGGMRVATVGADRFPRRRRPS